jgi:hypothetical protein
MVEVFSLYAQTESGETVYEQLRGRGFSLNPHSPDEAAILSAFAAVLR